MKSLAEKIAVMQSAELAECKDAYALLFAENARLRAEVEKRKPLTDERAIELLAKHGNWSPHQEQLRLIRVVERAHGIGES